MSFVATTELLNAYDFNSANIGRWHDLLVSQGIYFYVWRVNAMSEWNRNISPAIDKIREFVEDAEQKGIEIAVDFHTWYTTWDNYLRNSSSNQQGYIKYVVNTIQALDDLPIVTYMVLNEPQARNATDSENQFIVDLLNAAQVATGKPVSVRFMGGYNPTTGHYAKEIDEISDYFCSNTYWDARNPDGEVYGTTEAKLLQRRDEAHSANKEFWITEFGSRGGDAEQRNFVAAFVAWAQENDVDTIVCWASQISGGEAYSIMNSWTPRSAFYELTGGTGGPTPPPDTWMLNVHAGPGGSVSVSGEFTVNAGDSISVSASPQNGYVFGGWEINGTLNGFENPKVFTGAAGEAYHVIAIFDEKTTQPYNGVHARMFPLPVVVAKLADFRNIYERHHKWFKRLHDMLHPLI